MFKRHKMGLRFSRRVFKAGTKVKKRNSIMASRGGRRI